MLFAAWVPPLLALATAPVPPGSGADAWTYWRPHLLAYLAADTQNPPGRELVAADALESAIRAAGLVPKRMPLPGAPERTNLWARLPATQPGAPAIILLHHIDVVPAAESDGWDSPPFTPTERGGELIARGVLDTKGLAVLQLEAIRSVARRTHRRFDVIFLAVADEEVRGRGAEHAVRTLLDDTRAAYLLDEGGFCVRDFLNGHDVAVIAHQEKRAGKLRLIARGVGGHGARPRPDSAPRRLLKALSRLEANPRPLRLTPTTQKLFAALGGIAPAPQRWLLPHLDHAPVRWLLSDRLRTHRNLGPMLQDTLSLTRLRAGEKTNVIPAEASAILDVRLLPATPKSEFEAHVKAQLTGTGVEFHWLEVPPAPVAASPVDDDVFLALTRSIRSQNPSALVTPWLLIGASDSRFFRPRGVKAYGFFPVFLTKAQLDSIHGLNERVHLKAFQRGFESYRQALTEILSSP